MGKKKNKDEDTASATATATATTSAPASDIFKNLFGIVELDAVPSIFSDSNPFRRKPTETTPVSDENPTRGDTVDELNKKKRSKEKISDLGNNAEEASDSPSDSKKIKKPKRLKSVQPIEDEYGKGNASGDENKKRKKRKRDDIESEYEAKKYGTVSEDVEPVHVGEKRKKAENDADLLDSKDPEGFDDEDKLLRTVFVGNLPLKVKKKALMKEFSQFGEIESVRIRSVPIADTKIPRKGAIMLKKFNDAADSVHAYIVFKTEESAEASLSHNMAVVAGNHIRVDRACPPRKKLKGEGSTPLYDNKRTIFVGNLPFDVKDEEIYKLFTSIKDLESSIEAVRVIRDSHVGLGKGIAYVLFKTREAVNSVLKKRNLKIRNRELRISRAKQDSASTPSKRSSFPAEAADSPNKKARGDSRTPSRSGGFNTKASTSYQGLRASKSGVQKKVHQKQTSVVKSKSKSKKRSAEKHSGKRPAVAARKARAIALKDGSAAKQAGQKRKISSRTPESFKAKKKARKSR